MNLQTPYVIYNAHECDACKLTLPEVRYFLVITIVETSLIQPDANWLYASRPLRALNCLRVIKLVWSTKLETKSHKSTGTTPLKGSPTIFPNGSLPSINYISICNVFCLLLVTVQNTKTSLQRNNHNWWRSEHLCTPVHSNGGHVGKLN